MKKYFLILAAIIATLVGAQYAGARIYNPPASGLSSLTPWTENIDADGFSLTDLLNLTSTGHTTLATASSTALTVSGQTNLATTTITGNLNITGTYIPRVVSYNSASTTINVDTTDIASSTISTATTFVNPTGTPVAGQMFEIWGTATGTQTVYWGTNFASSTDLVNIATVATGTTKWLFEYRPTSAKYELVGLLEGFNN